MSKRIRRTLRDCPFPGCKARFLVRLSNHLSGVHNLGVAERKKWLQLAKARSYLATRPEWYQLYPSSLQGLLSADRVELELGREISEPEDRCLSATSVGAVTKELGEVYCHGRNNCAGCQDLQSRVVSLEKAVSALKRHLERICKLTEEPFSCTEAKNGSCPCRGDLADRVCKLEESVAFLELHLPGMSSQSVGGPKHKRKRRRNDKGGATAKKICKERVNASQLAVCNLKVGYDTEVNFPRHQPCTDQHGDTSVIKQCIPCKEPAPKPRNIAKGEVNNGEVDKSNCLVTEPTKSRIKPQRGRRKVKSKIILNDFVSTSKAQKATTLMSRASENKKKQTVEEEVIFKATTPSVFVSTECTVNSVEGVVREASDNHLKNEEYLDGDIAADSNDHNDNADDQRAKTVDFDSSDKRDTLNQESLSRSNVVSQMEVERQQLGTDERAVTTFREDNISTDPVESTKLRPPAQPILHSTVNTKGIELSWALDFDNSYAPLSHYDIFYHQQDLESKEESVEWNIMDSLKALTLPMSCTLCNFNCGLTYQFAIRAVDTHGREGAMSEISTITLG